MNEVYASERPNVPVLGSVGENVRARTLAIIIAVSSLASGQPRRITEQDIVWSTFVSLPGHSGQRLMVGSEPGALDLGDSAWACGYGRARQAAISADDWSVQRVLGCTRGEATVSATASCRVRRDVLEQHDATLSLGTTGVDAHATVTLSCARR
jgi:hypothetical protein